MSPGMPGAGRGPQAEEISLRRGTLHRHRTRGRKDGIFPPIRKLTRTHVHAGEERSIRRRQPGADHPHTEGEGDKSTTARPRARLRPPSSLKLSVNSRPGCSRLTLQTQALRRAKTGFHLKLGDSGGTPNLCRAVLGSRGIKRGLQASGDLIASRMRRNRYGEVGCRCSGDNCFDSRPKRGATLIFDP